MTGKEKVVTALEHREGPIPIDFGSSSVTGMHISIVEGLRKHYGLPKHPVRVVEPYQMLGEIEEDLKRVLEIDTAPLLPYGTLFGFPLESDGWKEWRAPWGQEVLMPAGFEFSTEGKEVFVYPQGDKTASPSARMPEGSFFFDAIIRQTAFDEDHLELADNLEEFSPVDQEELDYFREKSALLSEGPDAVLANFGGTGVGDIAVVAAPMLIAPKGIRDVEEWYISTVTRRDFVRRIFEAQVEISLANLEKVYSVVGEVPTVVYVCGTDFGTQTSTFCSPETFDELYAPIYRQMNDWIHENTKWRTFKHCCGSCVSLMQHFIDSGFDVLNPVQCSAAGMDPEHLKQRFGDRLVFWGGGVDTQQTLPFGTPGEVRREVLDRCRIFGQNGGFVFDSIHNVQAMTPIDNVVAMFDAVHEYNRNGA